jgi:hypothetical protein
MIRDRLRMASRRQAARRVLWIYGSTTYSGGKLDAGLARGAEEVPAQEEETRNASEKDGGYPEGNEKTPFLANEAVPYSEPPGQRRDRKVDDERGGQTGRVSMKEKRGNKVGHDNIQEHCKGIAHKKIRGQTLLSVADAQCHEDIRKSRQHGYGEPELIPPDGWVPLAGILRPPGKPYGLFKIVNCNGDRKKPPKRLELHAASLFGLTRGEDNVLGFDKVD